ncbi:MAG: glycolate oxidase subunit GlcF [Pseudomonadota bacterium]
MQTALADFIRDTPQGREADRILRACVHCGFCTATCPTYQLLGDELDGPRGRIYQIKQVLEGEPPSRRQQLHLDRCLTCRSCETTCPSGVAYGRLLEIGREVMEERLPRGSRERILRGALVNFLANRKIFGASLVLGRWLRPLIPVAWRDKLPVAGLVKGDWPTRDHPRRMLFLEGCVQPLLSPQIDTALARVLDRLGISLVRTPTGCCGALPQHLNRLEKARALARRNIDAWWPQVEAGAEAILVSASGCGVTVKEYGQLLADDPGYRHEAERIASLARDPVEILEAEDLEPLGQPDPETGILAFQSPCTLQHGQRLGGRVEALLGTLGYRLAPVAEPHLCCGSAGTYSLLQPELSTRLRSRKLANLTAGAPDIIATANIGCLHHLQAATTVPVVHWLELLDTGSAG